MWKKCLAFGGMLALVIMLDPSYTDAQPGGKGGGKGGRGKGGFGGIGSPDSGGTPFPGGNSAPGGGPGGYGGVGFQRPDGGGMPGGGGMGAFQRPGGMGGADGGMGGPGGGGKGPGGGGKGPGGGGKGPGGRIDPEMSWKMLQGAAGGTGDSMDLSKIPLETQNMLKGYAARTGGIPLPESGIMSKAEYLDYFAQNEAARAANGGGRGSGGQNGGFGQNGWDQNQNGWGQNGWEQNQGGGQRPPFEKKETEEERPVAMRYGKLPKDLPSWFDEDDVDKDGQVSLYEWRKSQKDTKEFVAMDLNGDGLVTADEYLRFTRDQAIKEKVKAYEASDGIDRPTNGWGLGAPVGKGDDNKAKKGPGSWGPGGNGGGKGGGKGGGGPKGDGGGKGSDRGGNDAKGADRGGDNPQGGDRGGDNPPKGERGPKSGGDRRPKQ